MEGWKQTNHYILRNRFYASRFPSHVLPFLFIAAYLIFATSSTADVTSPQSQNSIDYMIAVVNDQAITLSALENELIIRVFILARISSGVIGTLENESIVREIKNPSNQMKAAFLKGLIERKLLLQEAERLEFPPSQEKVDAEIQQRIKSKYDPEVLFFEDLKKSGLAYKDLEEWIMTSLIIREWIARKFRSNISEEMIEQKAALYYEQNRSEFLELQCQYIKVLSKPEHPPNQQAQAKQLAGEIYARLKAGMEVGEVQKMYNDPPNLYVTQEPQIVPANTKTGATLAKLRKDELSEPLLTPDGYLIARLLDKRQRTYSEVSGGIKDILIQREVENQVDVWLKEQWAAGDIRILDAGLEIQITDSNPEP